jgi:hypothetical protein
MLDLAMLLLIVVGFAAMAAYIRGCDTVTRPASHRPENVP